MSSLVRAIYVFCDLKKYDFERKSETRFYGDTTFDICGFRGLTSKALTTVV
jgi:hypothetical protein